MTVLSQLEETETRSTLARHFIKEQVFEKLFKEEENLDSQSHQRALPGAIPGYEEANYNSGWYPENNLMTMLPA